MRKHTSFHEDIKLKSEGKGRGEEKIAEKAPAPWGRGGIQESFAHAKTGMSKIGNMKKCDTQLLN